MMRKRKRICAVCILAIILFAAMPAGPVKAQSADVYGLLYGVNGEEKPLLGVAILMDEDGAVYAYTTLDVLNGGGMESYMLFVADGGDGIYYRAIPNASSEKLGILQWQVEDATGDLDFVRGGSPYQGEEAHLIYLSKDVEILTAQVVVTGMGPDMGDVPCIEIDGAPWDEIGFYPVAFLDADGRCVGMAFSEGVACSLFFDEEFFYQNTGGSGASGGESSGRSGSSGSSGGGSSIGISQDMLIIPGAAVVAVVVLFLLKKKNGGKDKCTPQESAPEQFQGATPDEISKTTPFPSGPAPAPYEPPLAAQPVPAVSFYVSGRGGYMDGRVYPIDGHDIVFGRDPSATVCFPAETKGVSRVHCKLLWKNGTLMLMDMGSTYGTFLPDRGKLTAMVPVPIKKGDKFYIADKKNGFVIS